MSSVKDHKELNELLTNLMNCKQDIVLAFRKLCYGILLIL